MTLGLKIKKRRKELGMTQGDLAKIVSLSRAQITNIELGNSDTTTNVLLKICEAVRSTPDRLLGFDADLHYIEFTGKKVNLFGSNIRNAIKTIKSFYRRNSK